MEPISEKLVLRKSNLKSLEKSKEFMKTIEDESCSQIKQLDISHNQISYVLSYFLSNIVNVILLSYSNLKLLDKFTSLNTLIVDYNHMKSVESLPELPTLRVLSMSYNMLGHELTTLQNLFSKCPALEHLNVMKNPCNPVFSNQTQYKMFRARFAIWIPTLQTLDGTDFKDDQDVIVKLKSGEQSKKSQFLSREASKGEKGSGLYSSLPEKSKDGAKIDKTVKAQSGTTAFEYN